VPPSSDDVIDEAIEGRQLKAGSEQFGLRLDDEGMVIVLAVTLAVVLVAITIVVVIFACIRSTDRRRTCVTSSSTAILSNVMSLTAESKPFPPSSTTLLPTSMSPDDRKRENGNGYRHGPSVTMANGNAKLNGTKMAAGLNGCNGAVMTSLTEDIDCWRRQVQQCSAGQQTAVRAVNETSVPPQVSLLSLTRCFHVASTAAATFKVSCLNLYRLGSIVCSCCQIIVP
jgi:hypothetical protein